MQSEANSFARRAQLTEWMDEPCAYAEFRACLLDLMQVNRTVLSYRPTLRWLENFTASGVLPLHIVDTGSGAGDMLRRIEAWAQRRSMAVRLTGIDANPHAARAACEFTDAGSTIEWITCEASNYKPAARIDIVISSLFTHHLADAEIVSYLQWMERTASRGWFINDLRRARLPYYMFKLLARCMRWHRFVRHDGPISIQRSFTEADWRAYAQHAGLDAGALRIVGAWPGRLCVGRVKA
ncbi:MAG TPA: methyltransferase domain-containing protein [Terracidiphilus sp.]|nr:methyltransferase domain-containing protein [Terracidiphilus sp.]